MAATKIQKDKILRFITYYNNHEDDRKEIRRLMISECGFTRNTFYYKLAHHNYTLLELKEITKILKKYNANETPKL